MQLPIGGHYEAFPDRLDNLGDASLYRAVGPARRPAAQMEGEMKQMILAAALCSRAITHAQSQTQDLFEALRQGDAAKVQAAVNHGVDVNSRDDGGNTLLMQAAVYSTPALMQFLLERGADPKASNERGYNALMRSMPDLEKSSCWRSTAPM